MISAKQKNDSDTQKSNIFVDDVVIVEAEDVTEKEHAAGFKHDVAIKVIVHYLDSTKEGWSKTLTVGSGKMVRNEDGTVVDWGAGFKVRDLLLAAGLPDECGDNGEVNYPELVGKEVKMLTYISSKTDKGKAWNHFTNTARPNESFIKYFLGQTKPNARSGVVYIKDFLDPNVSPGNALNDDLSGPWDSDPIKKDFI